MYENMFAVYRYLRIVHVAPVHDAVQAQVPEVIQVPLFEQAGKHTAKYTKYREDNRYQI
jgi:hypothetical protein